MLHSRLWPLSVIVVTRTGDLLMTSAVLYHRSLWLITVTQTITVRYRISSMKVARGKPFNQPVKIRLMS